MESNGSITTDQETIYHVSLAKNHVLIQKTGIDPALSRGASKTSWWVLKSRLAWAMAHVSLKHGVPVSELEVWCLEGPKSRGMKRTKWPGVYQTACFNRVYRFYTAERALQRLIDNDKL